MSDTADGPRDASAFGRLFPGAALVLSYQKAWLRPDLVAGLTVGAMHVPQAMAYAELGGSFDVLGQPYFVGTTNVN